MPPRTAPPAVTAEAVTLAHRARVALADATLTIPAGAVTALIGPNGSGKSTLLHALAGLLRPAAGRLEVTARRRRGGVALVLQATPVDRVLPLTAAEVVAMGRSATLGLVRRRSADDRRAVRSALERLAVADLADRQLHELSGGQRQRVLVAQGLAQEADLLLLDEPVTGLDLVSRDLILRAVVDERAAGRTVVVATHDLDDARRRDHVVLLAGRVVAEGAADDVLTPEHLGDAYGTQVATLPSGVVLLDQPHAPTGAASPR